MVGYTYDDAPVTAHDLKAEGAMAALLKDALKPNLVQTLEGTPAFVHGGPFANIAHGCNSIMATRMAMALGDYCVTEAGFGADLGAEKFLDIKCRLAGLKPDAVVVVATVRALKNHGGVAKADLAEENLEALEAGLPNLLQHVENITNVYNLPCVVAINAFPTDTKAELDLVEAKCRELGVNVALSEVWAKGGEGGLALADEVVALCENGDEAGRSADTFHVLLRGRPVHRREDRGHRQARLPCRRRGVRAGRAEGDRATGGLGLRQHARVHGQDPVLVLGRCYQVGCAPRLHHYGAPGESVCRRRFRGGAHGLYHDHAGPRQDAGRA